MSTSLARFGRLLGRSPLLILLIVLVIVVQLMTGAQLTWPNLRGVLLDSAVTLTIAAPLAMLVIAGQIDLSVGSTLALGGVIAGQVANNGHGSTLVALLAAILAGALVGVVHGALSTYGRRSSFIVTLGTLTAVRGAAQLLSPTPSGNYGPGFGFLGVGLVAAVPVSVWISVLLVVVLAAFLAWTPTGRHVYAIGINPEAAYLSGIHVRRVPFGLFVACGAAAGLAGAFTAARLNSAPAGQLGLGFELTALTAVLLGGVALTGGKGSMGGVVVGVLFLGLLKNGLTLLHVTTFWQQVASGLALIVAVAISLLSQRVRPVRTVDPAPAIPEESGPADLSPAAHDTNPAHKSLAMSS